MFTKIGSVHRGQSAISSLDGSILCITLLKGGRDISTLSTLLALKTSFPSRTHRLLGLSAFQPPTIITKIGRVCGLRSRICRWASFSLNYRSIKLVLRADWHPASLPYNRQALLRPF
jgi:hypothetical protein